MTKKIWNKGKSVGQKKPFTTRQIEMLKEILENKKEYKELALFSFGIDSMLRASDVLKTKVEDVLDHKGKVKTRINLKQQKTKSSHEILISKDTADNLDRMIRKEKKMEDDFLFTAQYKSGREKKVAMSYVKYTLLVKKWCKYLHLDERDYSTHSIRRTRPSILYAATGNIEAIKQLLGHKSVGSTSSYLNLDRQKAFDIYQGFLN